jgi:hypothetical protein
LWGFAGQGTLHLLMQSMKMLFFSSDDTEVQNVSREFTDAGISCEIRNTPCAEGIPPSPTHAELWIRDDRDCHRALMLCVRLGLGFAKKPAHPDLDFDADYEFESMLQSQHS